MDTIVTVGNIPALALAQINWVVEKQEGGWMLTLNANDPDGGWTFGGVTATTYSKHMGRVISCNEIASAIFSNKDQVISNCKEIYYNSYYLPAVKILESFWKEDMEGRLETYELSCIINLGEASFEAIVNETKSYIEPADFQNAWEAHYFSLVKQNAEAWQRYALTLSNTYNSKDPANRPTTLRAEFLHGWINRVRTAMAADLTV
jgi:hypothetical protein